MEQGFEFVQGDMMLAPFDAEQRHVGNPGLFAELGIRHFTSGFTQKSSQLTIKAFAHQGKVAKEP